MADIRTHDVTALLLQWRNGNAAAAEILLPRVYTELKRVAKRHMAAERPGHLLQATALVNEVYLRLVDIRRMRWQDRVHFFAMATRLMRRVLVDFARAQKNQKRGGALQAVTLTPELLVVGDNRRDDLIEIDRALNAHIVGTPAYMSPEQARGQAVDARTDVWAFGCVLYEMIVGRSAFRGATASDTIAKILERDPDWQALPPSTPSSIQRLLRRCLEKDPKLRLHAIADANFDLEEARAESRQQLRTAARSRAPGTWVIASTVIVLASAAAAWQGWSTRSANLPSPRVMPLTSYPGIEASPTLSPDGRQVAFSWDGEKGQNEDIHVVMVGADNPLAVTSDPARDVAPAWRPDGSEIAFARVESGRASIYLVSPLGGSEKRLAAFSSVPY